MLQLSVYWVIFWTMAESFKLYNYFRSSASYRVRIALHLKKIDFEYIPVHLVKNGGEQHQPEYKKLNPQSQVPSLVHNGKVIAQSMAIIQYLEDLFPSPRLFPKDLKEKAYVLQVCEAVNSGIQPLQNLSVLTELEKKFGADQKQKEEWIHVWMKRGFDALEALLSQNAGKFCLGNEVTAADCFLVPQIFAAQRFKFDASGYKKINEVNKNCLALPEFQKAEPSKQMDYTA